MKNKVFIKTFGCQMNSRDSEVITGLLTKAGYSLVDDAKAADVIIFNTCSVRQHAEDRVWSGIGRLTKLRVRRRESGGTKKPLIGLVGCMAKHYGPAVFEHSPSVDFVVGPSDIHKIPEIINELSALSSNPLTKDLFQKKIWETDGEIRPEEIYHTGNYQDKEHAYVVISEGCSNFCSYCVVPYVRGPLRNRGRENIIREIKEAMDKGVTSITLLGQNVNAFADFTGLLKIVNGMEGLKEFTFLTSHPKDATKDLFKTMAECDKLKKVLHLPVQSGSDRILKLMNRGYTRRHYLELVKAYRGIIPYGCVSSDIIVGFPTESENDFRETYDLMKEVEFNAAYLFKYSPRPNTEAAKLPDDVPKEEKERRHRILLDYQISLHKKRKNK